MKKSIKVKGIKQLDKTELNRTKAGGCGYIDPNLIIYCGTSFTIEYAVDVIIIGDRFTVET